MAAADGTRIVIVGWDTYDEQVLQVWLKARVHAAEAATWDSIASQIRLLGGWEFRELPSLIAAEECGRSGT